MQSSLLKIVLRPIVISFAIYTGIAIPHSEQSKARYVAESGEDSGYCEQLLRPCQTIAYAVRRANKGDKVLIASGHYSIQSTEELFYLTSEIVPVLAGFNRFDHYESQSPDVNQTFISGVPSDLAEKIRSKGFSIIADGKSLSGLEVDQKLLAEKMAAFKMLDKPQAEKICENGSAGGFPCNNIDLVAHVPLSAMSSRPSSGNDIWGHVDLNTGKEYAIIGVSNGAVVFDLSNPAVPVEVGVVGGSSSIWRDIKVYQYFDTSNNLWKAYAYVTIDKANDGVTIIDLNNLPHSVSLVERNDSVSNAHNVYISNIDFSLNIKQDDVEPYLQLIGSSRYAGSFHSYSLADPQTLQLEANQSRFNGYTHDGASVVINDARKDTDCINGGANCSVFVDFNEHEMLLWDITKPTDTRQLSTVGYSDVSLSNQYIHSGWVTEDKHFILLHDELDEYYGGLKTTVRIFQIDNLRQPIQVGQWTGPTHAIDHNGFVRGNRYYMSNYERGLTVLDITDPANPIAVGFFDTFPNSDSASFNGAWGTYPFLPSGLILVSDINSGLYVLRDRTQSATQGSLHFESANIDVEQGTDAIINVLRSDAAANCTSASVSYEVISGSAIQGSDFTATSGTLTWIGNETGSKSFVLPIDADPTGSEFNESLFVRLFDPKSGATLSSPSYLTVRVKGVANAGVVEFSTETLKVAENIGQVTLSVNREGGSDGAASVDYQLSDGTAVAGGDYENASGTLNWAEGDREPKMLSINIINDNELESDETFNVQLIAASGPNIGNKNTLVVTIEDDESNVAPSVVLVEDFEANTGQTVILTSSVSDPENDPLVYLWQQTSGTPVTIGNSDRAEAYFVAPSSAGPVEFTLTVTDNKGAATSDNVVVNIVAAVNQPDVGGQKGSGSFDWIFIMMLFFLGGWPTIGKRGWN